MDKGEFTLTFLGTGTSAGVPMVGCDCAVCRSPDPRNRRWRSSVYIAAGGARFLVDTSPDFREQALLHDIRRVDALLVTHAHVDHLFGLDDIRRINTIQDSDIPLYASPECLADIRRIFDYIFRDAVPGTYRPKLVLHPVESPFELPTPSGRPLSVTPFDSVHGWTRTFGYRFDFAGHSFAYLPDCHSLPEASAALLGGLDLLVVDALKYKPHPTHMTLDESLALIARLAPRRALLTHIGHSLDHETLCAELPARGFHNVAPAYDGLVVDLLGDAP